LGLEEEEEREKIKIKKRHGQFPKEHMVEQFLK
jgi:hypothetical protein